MGSRNDTSLDLRHEPRWDIVLRFQFARLSPGKCRVRWAARAVPARSLLFFPDYRHLNPYQTLLYDHLDSSKISVAPLTRKRTFSAGDIFHLHWEDVIFFKCKTADQFHQKTQSFLRDLKSFKTAGVVFFWTIHNFGNHEGRFSELEQDFREDLAGLADRIFVLNPSHIDLVTFATKPLSNLRDKVLVTPHGSYHTLYPQLNKADAKRLMGLDGVYTLIFGKRRKYKGFHEIFQRINKDFAGLRFCLAGAGMPNSNHEHIHTIPRKINDRELRLVFSACDCGVINFRRVLNSGSFILYLTFALPCFIPRHAAKFLPLPDDYDQFIFEDIEHLFSLLGEFSTSDFDYSAFQVRLKPFFERNSWDIAARRLLEGADIT